MAKKKKVKKIKKITKAKLKKMAKTAYRKNLVAWSLGIKERDGHVCVICGSKESLNSHHILNKYKFAQYSLEPNCGITLCVKHHQFGKFAAETNSVFFSEWLRNNRPEQFFWIVSKIDEEFRKEINEKAKQDMEEEMSEQKKVIL